MDQEERGRNMSAEDLTAEGKGTGDHETEEIDKRDKGGTEGKRYTERHIERA